MNNSPSIPPNKLKLTLALVLMTILFRLPTLFIEIFNGDEAHYAAAAMAINNGGLAYVDFVDKKAPLLFYIYAATFKIFGLSDIRLVHFVALMTVLATCFCVYKIVAKLSSEKNALLAALFYSLFSVSFLEVDAWAANGEIFANLPLSISVLFFVKNSLSHRYKDLFFCGLALMIAVLIKQQAAILFFAFVVALFFSSPEHAPTKKIITVLKSVFWISLGCLVPLILVVSYYIHHDHLNELYYWLIKSNLDYIAKRPPLLEIFFKGIFHTLGFMASCALLWVLSINFICKRLRPDKTNAAVMAIIFWLGLSFIAVAAGWRFYGHYYLLFYPPLAILAGLNAESFFSFFYRNKKCKFVALTSLILPPLFFLCFGLWRHATGQYEASLPFIKKVAAVITTDSTNADDRVFAWGMFPYASYYTKKLPASRFIVCEYLVPLWKNRFDGDTDYIFSVLDEVSQKRYAQNNSLLMSDLNHTPPAYIVDMQNAAALSTWRLYKIALFPELNDFLKTGYVELATVDGVVIYKRVRPEL